jgi:hypothetical protein
MPKSRKRGGDKVHRRRVQNRNKNIDTMMKTQQKLFERAMLEQINKVRNSSGDTSNDITTSQNIKLNTEGFNTNLATDL